MSPRLSRHYSSMPPQLRSVKHLKMSAEFRDVTQYNNHVRGRLQFACTPR